MKARKSQRGFTLVEMLVALLIFAVLAGAGVGLLRSSVDTQAVMKRALADLNAASRLRLLLAADLRQAVVRPFGGAPLGFIGEGGRLTMVRASVATEDGPPLQALRWEVQGDRLVRSPLTSDGRQGGGAGATLASDVAALAFRYRDHTGKWRSTWPDGAQQAPLPSAVEMVVEQRGKAPVTFVVALPQGPAPAAERAPA